MNMTQNEESIILSKNPNAAMQEMMSTIDSLRDVYTRETEALEAADARAFLEMQAEKMKFARQYQDGIGQILTRRDEMKTANPLLRRRLEDMQKNFSEISTRNINALKRMQRVAESLGNTIRHTARDAAVRQRAFSYGETGTFKSSEKKSVSMGVSETA
jgi:hypothetical protein